MVRKCGHTTVCRFLCTAPATTSMPERWPGCHHRPLVLFHRLFRCRHRFQSTLTDHPHWPHHQLRVSCTVYILSHLLTMDINQIQQIHSRAFGAKLLSHLSARCPILFRIAGWICDSQVATSAGQCWKTDILLPLDTGSCLQLSGTASAVQVEQWTWTFHHWICSVCSTPSILLDNWRGVGHFRLYHWAWRWFLFHSFASWLWLFG